jgi:hypothetical protein
MRPRRWPDFQKFDSIEPRAAHLQDSQGEPFWTADAPRKPSQIKPSISTIASGAMTAVGSRWKLISA